MYACLCGLEWVRKRKAEDGSGDLSHFHSDPLNYLL